MVWPSTTQKELNKKMDKLLAKPQPLAFHLNLLVKRYHWSMLINIFGWVVITLMWAENWRQYLMGFLVVLFWLAMARPNKKQTS